MQERGKRTSHQERVGCDCSFPILFLFLVFFVLLGSFPVVLRSRRRVSFADEDTDANAIAYAFVGACFCVRRIPRHVFISGKPIFGISGKSIFFLAISGKPILAFPVSPFGISGRYLTNQSFEEAIRT